MHQNKEENEKNDKGTEEKDCVFFVVVVDYLKDNLNKETLEDKVKANSLLHGRPVVIAVFCTATAKSEQNKKSSSPLKEAY